MRRLKIALLSRWYWEENRRTGTTEGGMVQQLAEAIAAQGHEVVVLSQSPANRALEQTKIGTLETWLTPKIRRRDFGSALRDKLAKGTYGHRKVYSDARDLGDFLARRGPFDLLWAQCEEPDGLVVGIAAQLGIKLPPVVTQIHALRYRFEKGVPIFTEKAALQLAFQHATRIVANSDLVADSLGAYGEAELRGKVRVINPNVERDFLRVASGDLQPHGTQTFSAEPGRVLFFGALNEGKGGLTFLEAAAKMTVTHPETSFVVVGGFTENNHAFEHKWRRAVEALRILVPAEKLELPGKIPHAGVIAQIQRASVVVVPSLFDAYSRAVAEALLLGRPVVTTKRVGAWPVVNEHVCGLVVEPNDPSALAEAISDVLQPGTHYAFNAQHLAHRLLHDLSPESVALQLIHQFSEVCGA